MLKEVLIQVMAESDDLEEDAKKPPSKMWVNGAKTFIKSCCCELLTTIKIAVIAMRAPAAREMLKCADNFQHKNTLNIPQVAVFLFVELLLCQNYVLLCKFGSIVNCSEKKSPSRQTNFLKIT